MPAPATVEVVPSPDRSNDEEERADHEQGIGEQPLSQTRTAESVGGATDTDPIEIVDREEPDEHSSSRQPHKELFVTDDEQEDQVDITGCRIDNDGAAREAHHAPQENVAVEMDTDNARRRYNLRLRAPARYRDARAYAPQKRRHYNLIVKIGLLRYSLYIYNGKQD